MYNKAWYEIHREQINEKRRVRHAEDSEQVNEKRRQDYARRREEILRKQREDRQECPHCHLTFRRCYMQKHISTRHQCIQVV